MNDTATFYDEHWSIEGAYDGPEAEAFQLKLFREMFPGFEEKVPKQVKAGDIILDIGCGPAIAATTYFGEMLKIGRYFGVDMSRIALQKAERRLDGLGIKMTLVRGDFLELPRVLPERFEADVIFCPGVLHYQPDMRAAIAALTPFLKLGGRFVTWVYKEPPPIRKLTDAYFSGVISKLPPHEQRYAVETLTLLGIEIGEMSYYWSDRKMKITRDQPLLGINAGEYTLHEFFYYYIMKLFHNPALPIARHYVNNLNAFGHAHVLHLPESEILAIFVELGYDLELWNPRGNGVAIVAVRTGLSEQEAARSC